MSRSMCLHLSLLVIFSILSVSIIANKPTTHRGLHLFIMVFVTLLNNGGGGHKMNRLLHLQDKVTIWNYVIADMY